TAMLNKIKLCNLIDKTEKNQELDIKELSELKADVLSIEPHGTPNCILAATTWLCIAEYYKRIGGKKEDISDSYYIAIKYLTAAEILESYSTASIYNAYFGKGLVASNDFGFTGISEMQKKVLEFADTYIDKYSLVRAEVDGKQLADGYIQKIIFPYKQDL